MAIREFLRLRTSRVNSRGCLTSNSWNDHVSIQISERVNRGRRWLTALNHT